MTRKVGYGSPPDYTKWTKGQSGNPSGRRKGARNLETVIRDELARKVRTPDGKTVSMYDLIAKQLVAKVAKGELKWLPLVIRYAQLETSSDAPEGDGHDSPDLMAEFLKTYSAGEEQ